MSVVDQENKRSLLERLRDNYRLVVIDDDDLKEVNTFKFNLLTLYVLVSTIMVLIGAMAISLIIFTPIKRMIPGYGDISDNSQYLELRQKVEDLDEQMKAQEVYNNGLRNLLTGVGADPTLASALDTNVEVESAEIKVTAIKNTDVKEASKTQELNQLVFATPLTGSVSAGFDTNIEHFGIDIVAPKNTPIKSVMSGMVINADWSVNDGNTVTVQHTRNIISVYKHNSALLVKTGDLVKSGQAIAIIGNTGKLTSGPHLHLEIWYNGIPVNPANFLTFN